jgi:hypothetical protein
MSAEIIPFVARPDRRCGLRDGAGAPWRSAASMDDLVMDHADTAPCEYPRPCQAQAEQGPSQDA